MIHELGHKLYLGVPSIGTPSDPNVPNPTRRIREILEIDDDMIGLWLFIAIQDQLLDRREERF